MISREIISELVKEKLEGTDLFLVDIHVSPTNNIRILIDNENGVTVQDCVVLSRALEEILNRDEEDFQLEVSSPGLSEPLKVLQQYEKNIGRDIEVITKEGQKHKGRLIGLTDKGLVMEELVKVKSGKKRPEIKTVKNNFDFNFISSTKVLVSYK